MDLDIKYLLPGKYQVLGDINTLLEHVRVRFELWVGRVIGQDWANSDKVHIWAFTGL